MEFCEWLIQEERQIVDRAVVQSYDRAFQSGLEGLIQRTKDPVLRTTFERMRSCPIKTSSGCTGFTDYLLGALIRHNCHRKFDPEQALNYMAFRLLSPVGENGRPKGTLWDFDESRPYAPGDNPLEARFKTFVMHDLRSICGDKIARIRTLDRPKGTVSIMPGRSKDDTQGGLGVDQIPDRSSDDENELFADILSLLRKQSTPDIPLVAIFHSILKGEGTRHQRQAFGHSTADEGRKIIVGVIEDYARRTENHTLLRLLDKIRNPEPRQPPQPKEPKEPLKPKLPPDEQDFRSIVDVLERHGRKVGTAILGKARRRWLERKPRDPSSRYANRLADVLAAMERGGVLQPKHGGSGGNVWVPGPRYAEFLPRTVSQG